MGARHFALASRKAKYISFFRCANTRKVPACAYGAAHGRIQTFDRIGGVDRLANQRRKGEKRDHVGSVIIYVYGSISHAAPRGRKISF